MDVHWQCPKCGKKGLSLFQECKKCHTTFSDTITGYVPQAVRQKELAEITPTLIKRARAVASRRGIPPIVAEDAALQGVEDALKSIDRYQPARGELLSWATKVVTNRMARTVRDDLTDQKHVVYSLDDTFPDGSPVSDVRSPTDKMSILERMAQQEDFALRRRIAVVVFGKQLYHLAARMYEVDPVGWMTRTAEAIVPRMSVSAISAKCTDARKILRGAYNAQGRGNDVYEYLESLPARLKSKEAQDIHGQADGSRGLRLKGSSARA